MERGVFHREYFEYLKARIASEITNRKGEVGLGPEREWSSVWGVANNIVICEGLENINPEEAEELYQEIISHCPHLEERLRKELEQISGQREVSTAQ
ncbi:hypothetical protein HYT60_01600 [Candidatus Woesebacteria bacterium]|nr:hypothetical protein [Candidatus Woesebacteria bacterium]